MNKTQDSGLIERLRKQARSRSSRSHETLEWAAIAALEAKDARIAELGADLSFADSLLSAIIRRLKGHSSPAARISWSTMRRELARLVSAYLKTPA